jgi:hypothetical protein
MGKKKDSQSKQDISDLTAGEVSWKKVQEMPADTSRIGQSFAMFTKKP